MPTDTEIKILRRHIDEGREWLGEGWSVADDAMVWVYSSCADDSDPVWIDHAIAIATAQMLGWLKEVHGRDGVFRTVDALGKYFDSKTTLFLALAAACEAADKEAPTR